ncbi:trypsin-like peptidase domain-containing protein [Streptomyces sp. NBC_00094]|uniref:effector-associated domain 2-containing protein n=1 Tax=Streptomyces sp. NBC_00094 TaxID=2903620 RepID=UPI00224E54E5|nr:trypsin-like peptidase domain-containing protein [Streptomyces sp. NBC_00094]MCX5394370.1 serine protease [Streptomyces sp. NBC_00094]
MGRSLADSWRVRILDARGTPVGAGVLVAGGRVVTCAHVVEGALGPDDGDPREAELMVDFPGSLAPGAAPVRAGVAPRGWAPPDEERADVAVLDLYEDAPADCGPARLRPCGPARDRIVRAFGQVVGAPAGLWVRARLVGSGGLSPEWMQLEAAGESGDRLRQGYSGAGVVDGSGDVLGLVVAEDTRAERRTGWMIPVEIVVRYCPDLADAVTGSPAGDRASDAYDTDRGPASYDAFRSPGSDASDDVLPPPWPPSAERDLARVLVKVRSFADPHRRERVLRDTGDHIAFHVERTGVLINDARAVLGLCLEYEDGIERFAAALRWYESGSLPMREFDREVARLRARGPGGGAAR